MKYYSYNNDFRWTQKDWDGLLYFVLHLPQSASSYKPFPLKSLLAFPNTPVYCTTDLIACDLMESVEKKFCKFLEFLYYLR